MVEEKNDKSSCCISLVVAAGLVCVNFLAREIVEFLQRMEATRRFIELLNDLGMIVLGLYAVLVIFITIISVKWPPLKLKCQGKKYSVRCNAVEMKKVQPGQVPANQPDVLGKVGMPPVHLQISITNYGLRLAVLPQKTAWDNTPADNVARFTSLNFGRPGSIIIPSQGMDLRFLFFQQNGNFAFEICPVDQAGYADMPTVPPTGYELMIVIVCTATLDASNLRKVVERKRPMKIKLVALDKDGRDDLAATRELYLELLKWKQTFSVDDDDSWMYRSRPIYW